MRLRNVEEINGFLDAIEKSEGNVWLMDQFGSKFNLKSDLSRYLAIADLIEEQGANLELFCDVRADEQYFYEFFAKHPDTL